MSCTTGSMSRRISASAALHGSGGSGSEPGGSASFDAGGCAGEGVSSAVGATDKRRRRDSAGGAHGARRTRRRSGAAARARAAARAMPPGGGGWVGKREEGVTGERGVTQRLKPTERNSSSARRPSDGFIGGQSVSAFKMGTDLGLGTFLFLEQKEESKLKSYLISSGSRT